MEEGYKKVIERHRDKFRRAVTVERLFSPLVVSHVVNSEEAQAIQGEHPAQRVDRLLDVIQRKDYETFKKFCVVLETTYPYMLNCMFLGVEPPTTSGELACENETCDLPNVNMSGVGFSSPTFQLTTLLAAKHSFGVLNAYS